MEGGIAGMSFASVEEVRGDGKKSFFVLNHNLFQGDWNGFWTRRLLTRSPIAEGNVSTFGEEGAFH